MIHRVCHWDSLRLIFHGSESLPLNSIGGSITLPKYQQFFGTQRIVISNRDLGPGTHQIPFSFQLPNVQYPPPMEHKDSRYSCSFKLTLYTGTDQIIAFKQVNYLPIIETRLLYTPYVKTIRVAKRPSDLYSAKIHSLDYLPGDTIFLGLKPHGISSSKDHKKDGSAITSLLLLQVVQIVTMLNQHDAKLQPIVKVMTSSSRSVSIDTMNAETRATTATSAFQHEASASSPSNYNDGYTSALSVSVPPFIPPSFTYGRVITISYRLRLVIPSHKRTSLWSFISGNDTILLDIPITIGTVSYDTYAPMHDLQVYSVFPNVFSSNSSSSESLPSSSSSTPNMPVPTFIPIATRRTTSGYFQESRLNNSDGDENDRDVLPPYSNLRLPRYEETTIHSNLNPPSISLVQNCSSPDNNSSLTYNHVSGEPSPPPSDHGTP